AMGLCATHLAWEDAALQQGSVLPERAGVYFGAGRGGAKVAENLFGLLLQAAESWRGDRVAESETARRGPPVSVFDVFHGVNPTQYLQQCPAFIAGYAAIRYGAHGPTLTNVNLCSAGAQAIGEAAWVIARDDADIMIAGGSDSMLNPAELSAFCGLDAVTARNDDGPAASRPFDLRRDGCVVAEGAAAVILEELGHAR